MTEVITKKLIAACDNFFITLYEIVADACNTVGLSDTNEDVGFTYEIGWKG